MLAGATFDGNEDVLVQSGLFGIADGLFTHTDRGRPALRNPDSTEVTSHVAATTLSAPSSST